MPGLDPASGRERYPHALHIFEVVMSNKELCELNGLLNLDLRIGHATSEAPRPTCAWHGRLDLPHTAFRTKLDTCRPLSSAGPHYPSLSQWLRPACQVFTLNGASGVNAVSFFFGIRCVRQDLLRTIMPPSTTLNDSQSLA
jgi:hypothetical protein